MGRTPAFVIGAILSFVGLVGFGGSISSGLGEWEKLYWGFGGCLISLTGILVIIVTLIWPRKSVDVKSILAENKISIPQPVITNDDEESP